jgi:hypothetical protein
MFHVELASALAILRHTEMMQEAKTHNRFKAIKAAQIQRVKNLSKSGKNLLTSLRKASAVK